MSQIDTGETNLNTLLLNMQPLLHEGPFVFCVIDGDAYLNLQFVPLAVFHEPEGITVVVPEQTARQHELTFESTWAWITLTVHSSMLAVGFLAAITNGLADAGISLNALSAYYHDHLFVPWESRWQAMDALAELSLQASQE
jgi:hypothetical protein